MRKIQIVILTGFIVHVLFAIPARASDYRQCMKDKMMAVISAKPCQFDQYVTAENASQSSCGPLLLDELMKDKTLQVGSPEFKSALDNKKRSGVGDIEELVRAEGKRCGASVQMHDNKITVKKKTVK